LILPPNNRVFKLAKISIQIWAEIYWKPICQ
jgi:hypothetical protein